MSGIWWILFNWTVWALQSETESTHNWVICPHQPSIITTSSFLYHAVNISSLFFVVWRKKSSFFGTLLLSRLCVSSPKFSHGCLLLTGLFWLVWADYAEWASNTFLTLVMMRKISITFWNPDHHTDNIKLISFVNTSILHIIVADFLRLLHCWSLFKNT